MSTLKWTGGQVELVQNLDGELELVKATPKSNAEYVFDDTSLASLFANIKESKLNVRAAHLVLHGSDTYSDSDFPKALVSAVTKESKKGEVYNFTYTAEQVLKFKPLGFALRLKFHKPCLYAFATDFKFGSKATGGGAKRAPLTFKRVNVDGETAPTAQAETQKPRGPRQQG